MKTYGDLFKALERRLTHNECCCNLKLTENLINNPTRFKFIKRLLNLHGGYCDCEVLMNALDVIDHRRLLDDDKLDRYEWTLLSEMEIAGKCFECGDDYKDWSTLDSCWDELGYDGLLCIPCYQRLRKQKGLIEDKEVKEGY